MKPTLQKKIKLNLSLENTYHINDVENPRHVYVLLHGYMLDGKFMMDTFSPHLPKDSLIISPNAPFLIPHKKESGFVPRYSWYFYDPNIKSFYINYEPSAEYINQLIEKVAPPNLDVTLIGYSQGGYLSPKIAEINLSVKNVIGIACIFRHNRFIEKSISYNQIHSKSDMIVNYDEAKTEFDKLEHAGQFLTIQDARHKLSPPYFEKLKTLL